MQFDAGISINVFKNVSSKYTLTNARLVTVISLLGFDFSEQTNFTSLSEYDFDVILDEWQKPEVRIASGTLENNIERVASQR